MSRDPAKSRPLSANVLRLMRLSRASPKNSQVVKYGRSVAIPDFASCSKQGNLFMEAASMGFPMRDFAPKFMTSQLAGIFDVAFSASKETEGLTSFLQIPMLLKSPELIVETLYWIDDVVERTKEPNKAAALVTAYESDMMKLPEALEALPEEPNRNVDELSYAFWLGYMYRYECLMHEESSRMVYGAFDEKGGACASVINLFEYGFSHTPLVRSRILESECSALLSVFFRKLRDDKCSGHAADPAQEQ